jgi:hypothetical protein
VTVPACCARAATKREDMASAVEIMMGMNAKFWMRGKLWRVMSRGLYGIRPLPRIVYPQYEGPKYSAMLGD